MQNQLIGSGGEDIAADFLKKSGYLIIKRNIKLSYFEIDIIAEINKQIIFIEVKTKHSKNEYWTAEDLLDHKKYISFKKAVILYCSKNKINLNNVRLDLIAVSFDSNNLANIKHYSDII